MTMSVPLPYYAGDIVRTEDFALFTLGIKNRIPLFIHKNPTLLVKGQNLKKI